MERFSTYCPVSKWFFGKLHWLSGFFSSGFVVSALSPIQRSVKLLAFSAQRLGFGFRLFGGALQILQSPVFSSNCKSSLVIHLGFAAFLFLCFGRVAFFAVIAQFYFEIRRCFHFNAVVANKSPKLTPTRTGFSSKAAAAQLSSPLAC